jgi:predicted nucleotidyltransferase
MERARELIKPYLEMDGVIGIYVVGSATRPYRDALSDYDIEIIIEDDVYERMPMDERQVFSFKESEPKVVDYEFYFIPWSDFVRLTESTLDLFHYPYQHAAILHDPEGRIEPIIKQLAELPEDVRLERMTVHFLEFLYRLGRNRKTSERGDLPINLALLQGDALSSLTKLIFLVKKSWPSMKHWSEQEFLELGICSELIDSVKAWLSDTCSDKARAMVGAVRAFLDAEGETFHSDMEGIQQWLFFTKEGKAAFERWGCR